MPTNTRKKHDFELLASENVHISVYAVSFSRKPLAGGRGGGDRRKPRLKYMNWRSCHDLHTASSLSKPFEDTRERGLLFPFPPGERVHQPHVSLRDHRPFPRFPQQPRLPILIQRSKNTFLGGGLRLDVLVGSLAPTRGRRVYGARQEA